MRRHLLGGLLILALTPSATAGAELADWTPRVAREHCRAVAFLAVRRAEIGQLVYTRPARYRQGVWTLQGFVTLTHAPNGLRRAPFTCTLTKSADGFDINPPLFNPRSLTLCGRVFSHASGFDDAPS